MISIHNYRSFDEEGSVINDDKSINIFIGKNNSGKSNILRFIKKLEELSLNKNNTVFFSEDEHKRNGKSPKLGKVLKAKDVIQNYGYDDDIKIEINLSDSRAKADVSFLKRFDNFDLLRFQNHYNRASSDIIISDIGTNIERTQVRLIYKEYEKTLYIPSVRSVGLEEEDKSNGRNSLLSDFDGATVIKLLFKMQNPDIGHEDDRKKFLRIQSFVREVLDEKNIKIEIPNTQDKIIVKTDHVRLSLDQFGTGIHQLIIIASALILHEGAIFCIEEPESHLHPDLQRKFLNFIKSTSNKYYITTHSSVFLDFDESINIHHVVYKNGVSKIEYCVSADKIYSVLDDLGYKNSDLLQSNGVIWVEGPSDRNFLNKWIKLTDESLVEGVDYSIMFYGGRNLANVTFSFEHISDKFIELLKINRNAIVLIDKDAKRVSTKLNATKQRIQAEIGESNCWITKGREIENYLSNDFVRRWLTQYSSKEGYLIKEFDKYDMIQDYIESITPKKGKNIHYNRNKNKYSSEMSSFLKKEDLNVLDLKKRITKVVSIIKQWNS